MHIPQTSPLKLVSAGILRNANGQVLLARRGSDQKLAGQWELPGGKVEPGEAPEDCLRRELREELGIYVRVAGLVAASNYVYAHGAIRLLAFDVEWLSGDLQLSVHDAVAWLLPREMFALDLAPADIPIVEKL